MSEQAHTPGPWHQGKDEPLYKGGKPYLYSLHVYAAPRSPDDDDTGIAWVSCRDDDAQGAEDAPRLKAALANARLIAAAPDLLEALKMARECIAYCRRAHNDIQSGEGVPVEAFLDAAITKATGAAS